MFQLMRNWINRYFADPQVVILIILLLSGFVFILVFGTMLAPVLAALVIAYLLDGMVVWLQRLKVPRNISVIVVFLIFLACLLVLLIWLLPLLSSQIGQFLQDLPSMISRGQKEMMQLPQRYPELISQEQVDQFLNFISAELNRLGQHILSLSLASVRGLISVIIYLILVPLLVFFFLKDKKKIIGWYKAFLPDNRKLAIDVWNEVNQQIVNYIRGKAWEILIVWVVTWVTFQFLKLKFSLLLSLFVGLSVLVPYIGATVMFLPISLIAFFQWGMSAPLVYTLIAYGIIQALDGNLLVPLLLSGVVNLHPVAIIVAVLLFGGLWGIWGLIFAIPLATLFHAVLKIWVVHRLKIDPDAAAKASQQVE